MIPVTLTLHNFLSYGESAQPLDFTGFRLACLSGQNGHGKSALLDAITWALWGQARKGSAAGKPDSGLLRIGQTAMQVEFVFDLSGERYRVIRSFELRKNGEKRDIQFQCWDEKQETYHSLTQKNQRDTQQLITQTLRMDYETFINSSFLLQGRADAFTRKKPQERKAILAEILNLARYDQLQALAREHARTLEKSLLQSKTRLETIQAETARRGEIQEALEKTTGELDEVLRQWEQAEAEVRRISEKKEDIQKLKVLLDEKQKHLRHQEEQIQGIEKQLQRLTHELEAKQAILHHQERIETQWKRLQEFEERQRQLNEALQQNASLERRKNELERTLAQEQSRLEQERVRHQGELKALEARIVEAHQLLSRKDLIEKELEKHAIVKRQIADYESRSQQIARLEKELLALQRTVEKARAEIELAQTELRTRLKQIKSRMDKEAAVSITLKKVQTDLRQFAQQAEELEKISERGQELSSHQKSLEALLDQLESQMTQEKEKIELLQSSDEAACPLCNSQLDEAHRSELLTQLREQLAQLELEQQRKKLEIQETEKTIQALRKDYACLKKPLEEREKTQAEAGRLEGELAEIELAKKEFALLEEQYQKATQLIEQKQYAEREQKSAADLEAKISSLSFDPEVLAELRVKLDELSASVTEKKRLEEAQSNLARWEEQQKGILTLLTRVETALKEETYCQDVRTELSQVVNAMQSLGYSAEEHQRVEKECKTLVTVRDEWNRLQDARQQIPQMEKQVMELSDSIKQQSKACESIRQELADAQPRIQEIPALEKTLKEAQEHRERYSSQRDRLHAQLGGISQQIENLNRMEEEKKKIKAGVASESKELRLYEILVDAFGPRGVQALIIENAIPEIEEEANRILARLTDNRTQVTLESLREKKTGGAVETLDIKISDEMGVRDYELYSGGEAFRTDLAVRIALSRLLARRAGTRLQTLVIDEGFGTQDNEGLENIVQVIRDISDEFEKILVVTHLETLKDSFPARIEVTKHPEKGSSFEVFYN